MYVFSFSNYILSLFRKGECCIDYTIEGDQCIGIVFKTIYITVINFFIDNFSIKYFYFSKYVQMEHMANIVQNSVEMGCTEKSVRRNVHPDVTKPVIKYLDPAQAMV